MYMKFKDAKPKALTLSYDDGVIFDEKLIEIMDKYGLKGTFNINTGLYRPDGTEKDAKNNRRLSLSEAKELYIDSGHEVAVHALTHPFLEQLKEPEIIGEIMKDRENIERDYKTVARGMAYPFGTYNDTVVDVLKKCGICYSRTTISTESFGMPRNWLTLHPTCHHNNPKLMELAKSFVENTSPWHLPQMFYLWGHSYEFNDNNNWEVIEEFAKYVSGKDDIWYATNIEIYDYTKAYENLQISVDKKIIHNPSAIDVWVFDNGETLKICSGETVYR